MNHAERGEVRHQIASSINACIKDDLTSSDPNTVQDNMDTYVFMISIAITIPVCIDQANCCRGI